MISLPWWLFLVAAALIYFLAPSALSAILGTGPARTLALAAVKPFSVFIAGGLVVISLIVALHQRRARRLLDDKNDLETIRVMTWREFERLVAELYRRQGYRVLENGGGGADGGIDLIVQKDGRYLVQCKHWKSYRVGVNEARNLVGCVVAERAKGGILVTAGTFTPEAIAYARRTELELIDGPRLAELVRSIKSEHEQRRGSD